MPLLASAQDCKKNIVVKKDKFSDEVTYMTRYDMVGPRMIGQKYISKVTGEPMAFIMFTVSGYRPVVEEETTLYLILDNGRKLELPAELDVNVQSRTGLYDPGYIYTATLILTNELWDLLTKNAITDYRIEGSAKNVKKVYGKKFMERLLCLRNIK